jgi:hypothetical protein
MDRREERQKRRIYKKYQLDFKKWAFVNQLYIK